MKFTRAELSKIEDYYFNKFGKHLTPKGRKYIARLLQESVKGSAQIAVSHLVDIGRANLTNAVKFSPDVMDTVFSFYESLGQKLGRREKAELTRLMVSGENDIVLELPLSDYQDELKLKIQSAIDKLFTDIDRQAKKDSIVELVDTQLLADKAIVTFKVTE